MPNNDGQRAYNDPAGGAASSIGPQIRTDYYQKKALIEAKKDQFFSPLADVTAMPKNMGKAIKRYHYLPILDDANINDQGIDAAGNSSTVGTPVYVATVRAYPANPNLRKENRSLDTQPPAAEHEDVLYFIAENAVEATAVADAEALANAHFANIGLTDIATATTGANAPWIVAASTGNLPAIAPVLRGGNLYGSSKDPGTIVSKLPVLSEQGGRVNRVGHKRVEIVGTLDKFGFFDEYTQESLDFDTDAELQMHINREMVVAANEINEDMIQIDLLSGAGINRFAGNATDLSTIDVNTGVTPEDFGEVTYGDLVSLSISLDNNRTPKHTKIISGTRMIDTKVINGARIMYIGSELLHTFKAMTDYHGNKAFIEVQHYAAAGDVLNGEAGTVDQFRIVVVPEMMEYKGQGATVTQNDGFYQTGNKFDIFPIMVVGDSAFTTIGFQTNGKTAKFQITQKAPGRETANHNDPYGEIGFMSIKWYYGTMLLRPERIAVLYTAARM